MEVDKIYIKGEDIVKIKGNAIDGVYILLKDGASVHLDSNIYGDLAIRFSE